MFELTKKEVVLIEFYPIKAIESDQSTRKAVVSFEFVGSNDLLDAVYPQLKSQVYQPDGEQVDLFSGGRLTKLKRHMVGNALDFGMRFAIYGGSALIDVVPNLSARVANATFYGLFVKPMENGVCLYRFNVRGDFSEQDFTEVKGLDVGQKVKLTISRKREL